MNLGSVSGPTLAGKSALRPTRRRVEYVGNGSSARERHNYSGPDRQQRRQHKGTQNGLPEMKP